MDPLSDPSVIGHIRPEPGADALSPESVGVRVATLLSVVVPFLGLLVAVGLLWGWGLDWLHLGLFLGMFVLTGGGITAAQYQDIVNVLTPTGATAPTTTKTLPSMLPRGPGGLFGTHGDHSDALRGGQD